MSLLKTALGVLFVVGVTWAQSTVVVTTKSGRVRGKLVSLSPALQVYRFSGIPYAEAPIGNRRFKKTVPKEPWSDTFDATGDAKACPQSDFPTDNPVVAAILPTSEIDEDCLSLSIWVPREAIDAVMDGTSERKPLSLFTFIHGGAFRLGALKNSSGIVLAAHNNIIVAGMHYRLGSLGFGYLGTDEMPGNMGLWDQMEALKWLCENIDAFGGDCNGHTIAGESAGAISVTYHLLSPNSRRYFTRAIAQSGTGQAAISFREPDEIRGSTNKLFLSLAGRNCNSSGDMTERSPNTDKVRCLRSVPASSFSMTDQAAGESAFFPVIDGDFIPRNPQDMLNDGDFYKAPLMIGFNKDEGSMFLGLNPQVQAILKDGVDTLNATHYDELMDSVYGRGITGVGRVDPLIVESIKLNYWPTGGPSIYPTGKNVIAAVSASYGDNMFACPTLDWAKKAADARTKVFAYHFVQPTRWIGLPDWMGTIHSSELFYVFGTPFERNNKLKFSYDDKMLSRVMMALWTNFAKYGDPNIRDVYTPNIRRGPLQQRPWPTYIGEDCDEQIAIMDAVAQVYQHGPGISCGLSARQCKFWNSFFPRLHRRLSRA